MDWTLLRIILIALTILMAAGIGLILCRILVRRLKTTPLDRWLVLTLGVIVICLPLIVDIPIAFIIWDTGWLTGLWDQITRTQIHVQDVTAVGWSLIESLLILALGVGIARTVMSFTIRGLGENRIDINIRTLIGRVFYIIILIIAVFWALSIWQVSIGVPVAVLGALTIAFSFAIQDILKDLVAGFYILLERPFHIGDQITIYQAGAASYTGEVKDIQIRATRLRIVSGEQVTIPNSLIFGGIVTDNSYYGERRATITITLSQEEFVKDETPQQIIKTLREIETILPKPEPTVMLSNYTGKLITLTVRFWIAYGQISTIAEAMYALRSALPNADLTIREAAGDV